MRTAPFPSHGLENVPGPVDPVGQSARGVSGAALAVTLGVAATLVVGAGADAEAVTDGAVFVAASSFEQPKNATTANIAQASLVIGMAAHCTFSCADTRCRFGALEQH
jgi:hypothetical protein